MKPCAFFVLLLAALAPISAAAEDEPLFLLSDACVRCHLTCERGAYDNTVTAWRDSVHFRPDVTCADCHGGDRYLSLPTFRKGHMGVPGPGAIVPMCGRCHTREADDFLRRIGAPRDRPLCTASCVDCHGSHRVEKAEAAQIVSPARCGTCHSFDKARESASAVARAGALFSAVKKAIAERKRKNLPTESAEIELARIRLEYAAAFHSSLAPYLAGEIDSKTVASLKNLSARLAEESPGRWKWQGLLVLAFLAVVMFVLIRRMKALPEIPPQDRRKS